MFLWRISNHDSLDGSGGLLASARWHTRGRPIVYLATSPAGALVEVLVHLELDTTHLPGNYKLLKAEVPEHVAVRRIEATSLPANWREDFVLTRTKGDEWLAAGESALLEVPSAILPDTANMLLNPLHPDAQRICVIDVQPCPYDRRLFRVSRK